LNHLLPTVSPEEIGGIVRKKGKENKKRINPAHGAKDLTQVGLRQKEVKQKQGEQKGKEGSFPDPFF
jgi:hypothetical protein